MCGSICKLLLNRDKVQTKAGSNNSNRVWHGQDTKAVQRNRRGRSAVNVISEQNNET